jgi:putative FmdB family regulatory protein
MPLYDFACTSCGAEFEERTAVGGTPACPSCGASAVERRFTTFGLNRSPAMTGYRAAESNARRRDREAAREARIAERKKRRAGGGPPGGG